MCVFTGTNHLVEGGKKDATFVAALFEPWVVKLNPKRTRIDCIFFDGASNVQKAGDILAAKFPCINVQTCVAHCVSLFFSDICKRLWQVRLMLVNYRRVYRIFGSGAMHSPYALFIAQSKNFNAGRKVGLIKAAGTRMAGHSYALIRMLRLRAPLMATITSAAFQNLKLKSSLIKKAEAHLLNPDMWEATFILQRCLFPMIRCLRLGDTSACGGMSKIVYYVHMTDDAIEKSKELLRNLKYFDDHDPGDADDETGLDLEDDFDDDDSDDSVDHQNTKELSDEEEEDDDSVEELHLGEKIALYWEKRRTKLITPLSLAGWFCSPLEEIRKDVALRHTGADRLAVEKVIAKLYYPMVDEDLGQVIQTFWSEFDDFQIKSGMHYARSWIWTSDEIKQGNCHRWHKLYTLPHTKVFGFVACRVCSKPLGCGNAERNWGNFKQLKSGKRSHLSADKSQKQATVYGAASFERTRMVQAAEEKTGLTLESRWTDADISFEMGLERWDHLPGVVPTPVVPKRIFKAWLEPWEFDGFHKKDPVIKEQFLHKYGGLHWTDKDHEDELFVADADDMEYQAGRDGAGWCVIGQNIRDGTTEPWVINCVIDEIAECTQPAELNVQIVTNVELRNANKERFVEEAREKKEQAAAKRLRRGR